MALDIELGFFEECRIIRYQLHLCRIYNLYLFFNICHKPGFIVLYQAGNAHYLQGLITQTVPLDSFYYPFFTPDDNPHAGRVFRFCHVFSFLHVHYKWLHVRYIEYPPVVIILNLFPKNDGKSYSCSMPRIMKFYHIRIILTIHFFKYFFPYTNLHTPEIYYQTLPLSQVIEPPVIHHSSTSKLSRRESSGREPL